MNDELLKNLSISCNHSEGTIKNYKASLRRYCNYFGLTLREFLEEAESDENNNVKWKHSRLKSKLIEYRHHLLQIFSIGTVKKEIHCIIFFYKFYDIEVLQLPKINEKGIEKPAPIYFKDLPDKEIIREAFKISTPVMKAMILFCCSSGCAKAETMSLTIGDYIEALSEYLPRNKKDIFDIIDYLNDFDNIVPTFRILRKKTNKYYLTYCSPEAVKAINAYILTRDDQITNDSPLFRMSIGYVGNMFGKINNRLNLGKIGNYRRFRSHMLRKFHASALYNDGMSLDKVNDLQGKSKNKTNEAYFMTNPEDLKYEYIKHLPAVTINTDVEKLSIKSPEYMQMEKENSEYKKQLDKLTNDIASIMERLPDEAK